MKTALVLSGHMRNYKGAYENQKEALIRPNNCDIFIVTSTVNTFVYMNGMSASDKPGVHRHLPAENGSQGFIEIHEYDREKLEQEIRGFYGDRLKGLLIEEEKVDNILNKNQFPDDRKLSGHHWAWHRVKQSNELRKSYEKKTGDVYDAVIKSRTDLVFNKVVKVKDYNLRNNQIFLCQHHAYPKIKLHDQFAFGLPKAMDIYCNMYDHYGKFREESVHGGYKSEHQLNDYLMSENLDLKLIKQRRFFGMLRGGYTDTDDKRVQV
mgnify:CR=1 FL=1|tara:strand:- start:683 stop:1477 length:795 start_codon:yes stop_codon:yes gene_type:complete